MPSLVYQFTEMLAELIPNPRVILVNPEIYDKLPIKVLNPYQIGSDLVSNAVAAFQKFGNLTTKHVKTIDNMLTLDGLFYINSLFSEK